MSFDNYGEWHVDHIKPLGAPGISLSEKIKRLEYLNTQPLWAADNLRKGCKELSIINT